ncbi:MAG: FAD dependent oxidoreductase TIGR03364, partial [Planctomycetota bacterium]
ELLTPEEVVQRQPCIVLDGLRGALFSPHEANVDPGVAIAAMHAWLRQQGVDVRVGCPVVHVEPGMARLADGSFVSADRTVICAGDDFASLLPDAFQGSSMIRCQLQMMALGPQPEGFVLGPMLAAGLTLSHYQGFAGCPSLPALRERLAREFEPLQARGIHVMVSQGDDGRLIVGDSHDYQPPFAPGLDATTEQLILNYLAQFFTAKNAQVTRRWTGTYAKCADGASVFRTSPLPGIEVITGVGGSGMTRSQALGEQTIAAW